MKPLSLDYRLTHKIKLLYGDNQTIFVKKESTQRKV